MAILTLAIGIGATTAMFTLVNTVLLRPLPFPKPDQLVSIKQQDHSLPGLIPASLSYPDYFDWRALNRSFAGIASYTGRTVALESGAEARHLDATVVSANFFDVLGVAPLLGRDFRPDEEKPGNRAVMLSYSLWQSAFGSAQDITSRTIRLGDHDYVVAGVMPKDFQFPIGSPTPALWISLSEDADGKDPKTGQRGFDCLDVIGRLKPGITLEQAKADLSLIARNLARRYPDSNKWLTSAVLEPELQHLTGDIKPALRLLFGAVTLVLLIACANVASLLMARGSGRSVELAVRASIGASRGHRSAIAGRVRGLIAMRRNRRRGTERWIVEWRITPDAAQYSASGKCDDRWTGAPLCYRSICRDGAAVRSASRVAHVAVEASASDARRIPKCGGRA
jgi:predicted permease